LITCKASRLQGEIPQGEWVTWTSSKKSKVAQLIMSSVYVNTWRKHETYRKSATVSALSEVWAKDARAACSMHRSRRKFRSTSCSCDRALVQMHIRGQKER